MKLGILTCLQLILPHHRHQGQCSVSPSVAKFCVQGYFVLAGMELGSNFKEDSGGKSQPSAVSVMAVTDIFRHL